MSKYYKVWVDVDLNEFPASFGEIIESDNDDHKMGDYMVFETREAAQAFIDDPNNYPEDHWRRESQSNPETSTNSTGLGVERGSDVQEG